MPGLSGVETYIKMKEINPNITVIMITGYAVEDDVKRAIQEGAYAIVYKPFDMTKILSILDDCLSDHHLIMVVDDHVADRQMVKQILWDKGYRVVEAATGEECLQKVREDRFQIILLDVKMPGMDGLETLKQVRALRPEVGVIMITGYSVEEMLQQAIQWGSFSCLRKPYEMDKLLDVVDQCLKQRPANKPTPHD